MVLLSKIERVDHVTSVARRILAALAKPFKVKGEELFVTSSIGIAVFPDDGDDTDTLLKHVGIALFHAKERGRNTYQYYSEHMNARSRERLNLENQLRKALDRDQLVLYYQPKVDVMTNQLNGAEALLRWEHPELGMIMPDVFIPIAEETGLIVPIGEWVTYTACKQCETWQAAGFGSLRISVNVSSRQFQQPGLLQGVRGALENSGLQGQYLVLELTESMIMGNPSENTKALHELKELGLGLSIDDFGTGYSSLSYLKSFPLDELKVDRSFVMDIPAALDDAAIVTAIIAMAHSLSLTVVAEGVETKSQLSFLEERGCDEYQGYLFSKPVPANEFVSLLAGCRAHRE
jgi:EAL domain-containing protein (putative c-di-GMP-specific phosphodiesterase class I)